jgi:hypothetical protein
MKKSDAGGLPKTKTKRDRRSKSRLYLFFKPGIIDSFSTWENLSKITTVRVFNERKKKVFSMLGRTHRDIKSQELKIMEGTMFQKGGVGK